MRPFAKGGFRVWSYSTESKLLYSAFSVFAFAALLVSVALYEDIGGPSGERLDGYYRGGASPTKTLPRTDGPAIDLPDEETGAKAPIQVATSYRKLLEVTHFHLFTMPIFLLVIAHLFLQTGAGRALRRGMIVASFGGAALHVIAPWAVRAGPGFRWLYVVSGVTLLLSTGWMVGHALVAMWLPPPRPPAASAATPASDGAA